MYLPHIQSPGFHPERLALLLLPYPKPRIRGMSPSYPPLVGDSSFVAPHLKQLERLAKLCAPQPPTPQYQSPSLTSRAAPDLKDEPLLPPPKLPGRGSPHLWHESRLWKFKWWHDRQFQSPGLLIFLRKNEREGEIVTFNKKPSFCFFCFFGKREPCSYIMSYNIIIVSIWLILTLREITNWKREREREFEMQPTEEELYQSTLGDEDFGNENMVFYTCLGFENPFDCLIWWQEGFAWFSFLTDSSLSRSLDDGFYKIKVAQ